ADHPLFTSYKDVLLRPKLIFARSSGSTLLWILIEADNVASGVAEAGGDLGRVRADGLHELAPVGDDGVNRGGRTVHHDVNEQPWRGRRSASHPGAAHLAHSIVERDRAVTALPDLPAENLLIEFSGAVDVDRRHM